MGRVCRGTTPGKDLVLHLMGEGAATHEDLPHVLSLLVAKDAPVGMGRHLQARRSAVQHVFWRASQMKNATRKGTHVFHMRYAFKCHRKSESGRDTVYPVNAIAFHPIYGTFATGGHDGFVNVWDGTNKKRLYQYSKYASSIAALSFSKDGHLLAVASSYGYEEGEKPHEPDAIFIRGVNEVEVKPKPKALAAPQ
ncbi:unnamed protein product [Triticum turgidum subsp. durum]|uniref:Mitotic checkpoint protein n=1 Tax=Triticum turgidum subsp. durum TaxID=4567 RepID=A0A9R0S3V5_TRITD|nr:unnamed protein product [Triticum turgidum subsp. durum]